ncbi:MAG: TonB-dependent receptor [Tannerella sp.]|jgi:TonB-linked SusC/RagA family outer membrane protein|nr:TonB-dependent receptor [Tannerella sp.]
MKARKRIYSGGLMCSIATALLLGGNLPCWGSPAAPADKQPGLEQQQTSRTVTGKVVDTTGEPIVGATILEKGTSSNGVVTDVNGHFSLTVKPGAILQISYVGYKTLDIKATSNMKVTLSEDSEKLGEVVVVGYGTQKKVNLTGAVATVDVKQAVDSRPISDIGRALQGSVPGLVVSTKNGSIGGAPTIKIRGSIGSPNGDANPLILVDNVECTDISLVNPDDIESISVLKDAASASIYGARGAFGVVLITTKAREKHDRVSVKYSANFSWRTPTVKPAQLPGWEQASINLQGEENASTPHNSYNPLGWVVNAETVQKMKDYWDKYGYGKQFGPEMVEGRDFAYDGSGMHYYRTWDWYDMAVRNWSPQENHTLSVNGGNGKTNYNVSLGYLMQNGMWKVNSDNYNRYNGNFSLNSELSKYVTMRAGLMYTRGDYDYPFTYGSYNRLYYLYRWQPMYPYGLLDGKPFRSALTELEQAPMNKQRREYVRMNGGLTIKPIKDLSIDIDGTYSTTETQLHLNGAPVYGYNIFTNYASVDALKASYGNFESSSYDYTREEYGRTQAMTGNFVATYQKQLGAHNLKVMAGSNLEKSEYKYYWVKRMNLLDTEKPELNLATGDLTTNNQHTWWAVAGFFGRINYNYKDRYLLELNGRYDGSSRFPAGSRFAFFPSGSAGWRASEESFMQGLKPYLSTLKIRGSYGAIGNQDVGNNVFVSTMTAIADPWIIDGKQVQSIGMPTMVAKSLTWERVSTLDIGADVRFFNDALGVTFDWYDRRTSNILTKNNTLPLTLGADAPYENLGAIKTPGWELAVDYHHTFANGFNFGVTANISDYKTIVDKWVDNTGIPTFSSTGTGWWSTTYYKKGMVLGDIWGLKFDRFLTDKDFNADGTLKAGLPDQTQVFPRNYRFAPGDVLYKDLDGDGVITKGTTTTKPGDLSIIGNALPRFQYGFNIDAGWKGFDFNMFLQGVAKRDLFAAGNQVLPGFTSGEPYYKGAEDYWTEDNQNAYYPRPMVYGQSLTGNYQVNDRYMLNMAYLRCKSLTLGYSIPKQAINRIKFIKNLRVYFTAENLFTIDGLKPEIDPEVDLQYITGTTADARSYGRSYPYYKSLSFGLQLTL